MRIVFLLYGLLLNLGSLSAYNTYPSPTIPVREVTLQGLDKVTGRVFSLKTPVGQPLKFGSLRILVRAVFKTPPEDTPETAAFIEILDQKEGDMGPAEPVFQGWMFASSPAISALENPVYDVWVAPNPVTGS